MRRGLFISLFAFVISLINIFISLYYFYNGDCTENFGIAFGIRVIYVEFVSLFILIALILIGFKIQGIMKYLIFGITLLGVSNFIVRISLNYICDYINILNTSLNITDIFIVIYASLAVLIYIFEKDGKGSRR